MKTEVSAIYPAFQGEQNEWGIGEPVIFLRLSFCHLRCYLSTLGTLCDTPEALEKGSGKEMSIPEIIAVLDVISEAMGGVKRICLTGGDPLARPKEFLHALFQELGKAQYNVSVETSGTIDPTPYFIYNRVSWVLDYKGKSTGVKQRSIVPDVLEEMSARDFVKFVIFDEEDYNEMLAVINPWTNHQAQIVAGIYQGAPCKLDTLTLFNWLVRDSLLGKVKINMQTHKFAVPDYFINPEKYVKI
jgi:7-carboxy-7-deazaguanine synthase